jgi:hypothetical protein
MAAGASNVLMWGQMLRTMAETGERATNKDTPSVADADGAVDGPVASY